MARAAESRKEQRFGANLPAQDLVALLAYPTNFLAHLLPGIA